MLPLARTCSRHHPRTLASPSAAILRPVPRPPRSQLNSADSLRRGRASWEKIVSKKPQLDLPSASRSAVLLREKAKLKKALDLKRKKHEKALAAQKALFRLPPHEPRPDAIPFGTAMFLLRGLSAKQQIFVRSRAAGWTGETKVVAMVRVVPNDHHPRGIKGRVKFPRPVVTATTSGKKERIAAIVEGEQADVAKKAGMIVGGKEYLDKVTVRGYNWLTLQDCENGQRESTSPIRYSTDNPTRFVTV
jgi:hypothetical protein